MNTIESAGRPWTVHDAVGVALSHFHKHFDTAPPVVYALYRKRKTQASQFHSLGKSISVVQTTTIAHDNELWAFAPGEAYLLAFWDEWQPLRTERFPIRTQPLEEARGMAPIELLHDEEGNYAGWARTKEHADHGDTPDAKTMEPPADGPPTVSENPPGPTAETKTAAKVRARSRTPKTKEKDPQNELGREKSNEG